MNNKKTANYKQKDILQQVPLKVIAEIDLKNNLDDICQDCNRPLSDKDEWVCECGATHMRDVRNQNDRL